MSERKVDTSKWIVVYPQYINKKKTIDDGRRVALDNACENPSLLEMERVAKHLGFEVVVEPTKAFPKDPQNPGRLRVRIKKADGSPVSEEVKNKNHLLIKLGTLIPQLASRVQQALPQASGGGKKKKGKGR